MMTGRRNCGRCTRWRPITDFSPRRWKGDECVQVHAWCKPCRNAEQNRKYRSNATFRRKRKEDHREHQATKRREKGIPVRKVGFRNRGKYGAGRIKDYDHAAAQQRWRDKMTPEQYRAYRKRENERKRKK